MQRFASMLAACTICAAISSGSACGASITGTVFNLPPNFVAITGETVTITVFKAQVVDGRFINQVGGARTFASDSTNGSFTANFALDAATPRQLVNIEFSRDNATTNVLTGVVLEEGKTYQIDVVVPTPEQMANSHTAVPAINATICPNDYECFPLRKRHGWFGR